MERVRCNMCYWIGNEEDLEIIDEGYIEKIQEHIILVVVQIAKQMVI